MHNFKSFLKHLPVKFKKYNKIHKTYTYIHKTSASTNQHIPHEGYNLEVTSLASHQQDAVPLFLGFPLLQCCCLWAGCSLLYLMSH